MIHLYKFSPTYELVVIVESNLFFAVSGHCSKNVYNKLLNLLLDKQKHAFAGDRRCLQVPAH
jgi:hypothetical protein